MALCCFWNFHSTTSWTVVALTYSSLFRVRQYWGGFQAILVTNVDASRRHPQNEDNQFLWFTHNSTPTLEQIPIEAFQSSKVGATCIWQQRSEIHSSGSVPEDKSKQSMFPQLGFNQNGLTWESRSFERTHNQQNAAQVLAFKPQQKSYESIWTNKRAYTI